MPIWRSELAQDASADASLAARDVPGGTAPIRVAAAREAALARLQRERAG